MEYSFREYDLSGIWRVRLPDGTAGEAALPGTLDTNGIGGPDRPAKQWHDEIKTGRAEDDTFGGESDQHPVYPQIHLHGAGGVHPDGDGDRCAG